MDGPHTTTRLLCGTQRSCRAAHVDAIMRDHWGRAFLLVPTKHYASRRMETLILEGGLTGSWGRCVMTFDEFTERLLRAEGHEPVRVDDATRRLLLERALADLDERGRLGDFAAVADTAGFASHMLRVITQLKQAAIEPHVFRERIKRRANTSSMDEVVAEVYTAYQHGLVDAGVYDLPGLFWQAALECEQKRPALLDGIEAVLLDGFDDFTRSEFHLLERLAPHLNMLVFGLNYDTASPRSDQFALPARTAKNIVDTFGAALVAFEETAPATQAEFAATHIFWRDTVPAPDGLVANVEVMPCPDYVQEIETIGRRIKTLLLSGETTCDQIAVIYRNLGPVAATIRAVFAEYGIPVRVLQPPRLWESSLCSFVMGLIEAVDEWPVADVVDVMSAPWFSTDRQYVDEIPVLARLAEVMAGREEWWERLEQLDARLEAAASDDVQAFLRRMPHARAALAALQARLERLDAVERLLPSTTGAAEFAAGLLAVLDELSLDHVVAAHAVPSIAEAETAALRSLRRLLREWQAWNRNEDGRESRLHFAGKLREALKETTFGLPQPKISVVCMDAIAARHLRFDYVFFGGVNEGDVPCPPSGNAVYAESDIDSLRAVGISLDGRQAQTEREMLLFHHVLSMPRTRLCISWHRIGARGKDRYPSPYIDDLRGLFPDVEIQASMPPASAFVPEFSEAGSWRDVRNAIHMRARRAAEQFHEQCGRARVGADVEAIRHAVAPFDNFDGMLRHPDVVAALAARYGEDHLFSVNQLERYAACPFGFLVERVLEIDGVDAPTTDFDPRLRGTLMHDALQAFHEHYRGRAVVDVPEDEARATMRQALDEAFNRVHGRNKTAPHAVAIVERERMAAILERYLLIERERGPDWKPSHFEVEFGGAGRSQDTLSSSEPFRLETEHGPVNFSGRIDRIDLREAEARIVDYKTSIHVRPKDIDEGRSLQLAVYAMALEALLLKDVRCAEAAFVKVGSTETREALGRGPKKDLWAEREQVARAQVAKGVAGIRSGQFPPTPAEKSCAYCGAKRACRYEKGRIERKEASS